MGYLPIIKGNKCYHPSFRKFCIPMDVTFEKKKKIISQGFIFKWRQYLWKIKISHLDYLTFMCCPWILSLQILNRPLLSLPSLLTLDPKSITIKPSQVYLRRSTTAIKPVHTQKSKSRPSNSFISPSTSNVDNDINFKIAIRKGTSQYTQHQLLLFVSFDNFS